MTGARGEREGRPSSNGPKEESSRPSRALRRAAGFAGGVLLVLLLGLGGLAAWPYVLLPRYRFQDPAPFSGPALYNPYAHATGRWWKANFHAHSHAWGGLTNGRGSPAQVIARYRELGYDIPCVSNYESIDGGSLSDPDFIPVYEHGYNIGKVHQLVIGAPSVLWLDFPFFQSLSERQYILDRLNRIGGIVVIAHPWLRNGYPLRQLRYLTHYRLIEVTRHGQVGTPRWDAALSAGHLAWALGDDDTHDAFQPGNIGMSWTMVKAPSKRRQDVLAALRAGHTYAVRGTGGVNDVLVREVALRGDTLVVRTDPGATAFRFIGQGGEVREVVRDSMEARYVVRPGDSYVRTEVVTPRTRMFLNPVVRWDGRRLPEPTATFDAARTWRARAVLIGGAVLVLVLVLSFVVSRSRSRRRA